MKRNLLKRGIVIFTITFTLLTLISSFITGRANINTGDAYDVNKLSYEERYKVQCGPRQNYEILSAFNPEFYADEQLSVVGKIVAIEDTSNLTSKGHQDLTMSGGIRLADKTEVGGKNVDLIYHISDDGLADGGGIWRFKSHDDSFSIGDMVIIYGTGATAVYNPDYVWMDIKYMDFYKE